MWSYTIIHKYHMIIFNNECHPIYCYYTECYNTYCHFTECHHTKCHFTECHYTECRGAVATPCTKIATKSQFWWFWCKTFLIRNLQFYQGAQYLTGENLSHLGRVFNFKLGSFSQQKHVWMAHTEPLLELKTRPWFCPFSWRLSMNLHRVHLLCLKYLCLSNLCRHNPN